MKYYIKKYKTENLAIQDPQNKHGADNMFIGVKKIVGTAVRDGISDFDFLVPLF